jgi:hypothetical protein
MTPHSRINDPGFFCIIKFLLIGCLYVLFQATVYAQDQRTITAHHIPRTNLIHLDGLLDETAWSQAVPATDFIQQEPIEGQPATEKTKVFIIFDRNNLYIGAMPLISVMI